MKVDIPLLTADDIERRVQSVSKQRNGVFAKILWTAAQNAHISFGAAKS